VTFFGVVVQNQKSGDGSSLFFARMIGKILMDMGAENFDLSD
jgi:hypothetical protein